MKARTLSLLDEDLEIPTTSKKAKSTTMMMDCPNNGNGNKDPVKILYFDVAFQGNSGGRLVLKSRSMAYFAANGNQQSNIAWNAIAKLQTGATRSVTGAEYLLKIFNPSNRSITFGMKNESDLERIRIDIQECIQNYRRSPHMSIGGDDSDEENSLACFPPFVNDDKHANAKFESTGGTCIHTYSSSFPTSVANAGQQRNDISDFGSIFCDEEQQSLASHHRSTTAGTSKGINTNNNDGMKGEIVLEGKAIRSGGGAGDASTIGGSSAAGSMISGDHPGNSYGSRNIGASGTVVDPEIAAATNAKANAMNNNNNNNNNSNINRPDGFRDEGGDDYVMPVASFRLVPEGNQAYYHPPTTLKEDPWMMAATSSCLPPYYYNNNSLKKSKGGGFCRSKWFWITLLLLALLLVGIAIGMPLGVFSSKRGSDGTQNTVAGLQDTTSNTIVNSTQPMLDESMNTTTPPSQAPTSDVVVAAAERTPAPTFSASPTTAPSTGPSQSLESQCDNVGHDQLTNSQSNAVYAGSFGGSSYCRASILSLCEWTKWIPFKSYQGVGSTWFKAMAIEDSFCVADIEHQIQLHVPEGVDYDLHVYHQSLVGAMIPHDSSTVSGSHGNTEAVIISNDDGHLSDQSFQYYIQIEYKGGSSCEPWTLELYGHQCL